MFPVRFLISQVDAVVLCSLAVYIGYSLIRYPDSVKPGV